MKMKRWTKCLKVIKKKTSLERQFIRYNAKYGYPKNIYIVSAQAPTCPTLPPPLSTSIKLLLPLIIWSIFFSLKITIELW